MKPYPLHSLAAGTVAVALLALSAAAVRGEIEDKISNSFKVQPGGQLVVGVDRGSIEVKTVDNDSLDIVITRKTGANQAKAEKIFKDHVIAMTQDGNTVKVRAEYKGEKSFGWFGKDNDLHVNFLITVPRAFDVDLKTAGGSIEVTALNGRLQAHTSGGSLRFEKIQGPVTGHTSGGSITLAGARGKVDVSSSGGSLHLKEIQGDVNARTSGGSVHADNLAGKSVLKTSGGGMKISGIKGQVDAATSGGSITASLPEQPSGDCSFKTSGGSITIALGEKVAVDVDARTSAGRVSSDLPVVTLVQGEQKKNELHGKINGGGPLITAHTSAGSIQLEKQ